ncbi:F-box/LRR-repeat protein 13-like [Silene latifolia]|uniref:F-box/LRR-repeat protein 13-like n=1 Tax=Silene latifolia TaxID=37657 RepID=UPI003D781E71
MENILNISTPSISGKPDTDTVDRLSSLPNHLISEIISKLPTDSAVATSILSRHWRYQWTHITRFHLTSLHLSNSHDLSSFLTTVNSILQKLSSFPNNLHTFYLNFRFRYRNVDHIDNVNAEELCLTFFPPLFHRLCSSHTERFEVSELRLRDGAYLTVHIQNAALVSIYSPRIEQNTLSLPECIFHSTTLLEFILTARFLRNIPHYLNLPNLKKLTLQIFEFDGQLMRTFFKSLPLVEELTISACLGTDHFIDISGPNLKIFTIIFEGMDSKTDVLIDAPKLEHISISTEDDLVLFRFVKIPIHLLRTTLMHWSFHGEDPDDVAILGIVKAISCTRSLHLCCPIVNVMNSYNVDEVPTFHNLVDLSLALSNVEIMCVAIPGWILARVKTVKVREVVGYEKEMSLMENILSKASVLELLCVFVLDVEEPKMDSIQKESDFVKALFMLPRVSSSCEIEFNGRFVRASTNVVENASLT